MSSFAGLFTKKPSVERLAAAAEGSHRSPEGSRRGTWNTLPSPLALSSETTVPARIFVDESAALVVDAETSRMRLVPPAGCEFEFVQIPKLGFPSKACVSKLEHKQQRWQFFVVVEGCDCEHSARAKRKESSKRTVGFELLDGKLSVIVFKKEGRFSAVHEIILPATRDFVVAVGEHAASSHEVADALSRMTSKRASSPFDGLGDGA